MVAEFAVPVAVLVLLVSGCAFCVVFVVFRQDPHHGEMSVEGSHLKEPHS